MAADGEDAPPAPSSGRHEPAVEARVRRPGRGPPGAARRPAPPPRPPRPRGPATRRAGRGRRSAPARPLTAPPCRSVPRTRVGCWAMYVAECFTRIWLETKTSDPAEAKWPTTTTGMPGWKSCGGDPVFSTAHLLSAAGDREVGAVPGAHRRCRPPPCPPGGRWRSPAWPSWPGPGGRCRSSRASCRAPRPGGRPPRARRTAKTTTRRARCRGRGRAAAGGGASVPGALTGPCRSGVPTRAVVPRRGRPPPASATARVRRRRRATSQAA